MDMMVSTVIIKEYEPYSEMEAFWHGYQDYVAGRLGNEPYPSDSLEGQAYDRGLEAAMRTEAEGARSGISLDG